MSRINHNHFYVDIGTIICPHFGWQQEYVAELTFLWKSCCNKEVVDVLQMPDELDEDGKPMAGLLVSNYMFGLSCDAESITIEPRKTSALASIGVRFIQKYMTHKHQYDANGHFPFPSNDHSGVMLAVDTYTRESGAHTVGVQPPDPLQCLISCNRGGSRIMLSLETNDHRSNGGRTEIRTTYNLTSKLIDELRRRRDLTVAPPPEDGPTWITVPSPGSTSYYVHPTADIQLFLLSINAPLALWYEQIIASAPTGELGPDRQKLALIVNLLRQVSYGGANIKRHSILYKEVYEITDKDNDEHDEHAHDSDEDESSVVARKWGLAFRDISQEYGFCYLHDEIFDWSNNNFQAGVADRFKDPTKFITVYRARTQKRKEINTILLEVDLIIGRLLTEPNPDIRKFYIHFLQIRVLWQYFSDVWEQIWESPLHFRAKERRRRKEKRDRQAEQPIEEEEEDDILSDFDQDEPSDQDEEAMETESDATDDPPPDEAPIRSRRGSRPDQAVRRRKRQRKMKGLPKNFEVPPELDFPSVCLQLGEDPENRPQGPLSYRPIQRVFADLFHDRVQSPSPNWKKLKYLKGYQKIRERLLRERPELADEFRKGLFRLFTYYCLCIPAYSKARWISPRKVGLQNKVAWLSFMKCSILNDMTSNPGCCERGISEDSWSWTGRQSITDDFCWGLSARTAISAKVLDTVAARDRPLPTDKNIYPGHESRKWRRQYRFYSK